MPTWSKFKVGAPAIKGFNQDCQKFETVSHTSHVASALSILDRGEIHPYLVFDESKLNDQRILVSWLSPNHWGVGFRYGNIRFDFDFKSLIDDKHFYWVELGRVQDSLLARILVTDKNHDGDLEEYDPTTKKGPWWHDTVSDQHYYNGTQADAPGKAFNMAIVVPARRSTGTLDRGNPTVPIIACLGWGSLV